jgi:hypothetical protein
LLVNPNTQGTQIMLNQGFDPWTGLGVTHQDITQPTEPLQKNNRHGLGFKRFLQDPDDSSITDC